MSTNIVLVLLAVLSVAALGFSVVSLLLALKAPNPAHSREDREGGITVDYLSRSGRRSELRLDPENMESIERFLESIRRAEEPRGSQGEPTAAR